MDELKKEYTMLFNGITDMMAEMERMIAKMKDLQLRAEELCLTYEAEEALEGGQQSQPPAQPDADAALTAGH